MLTNYQKPNRAGYWNTHPMVRAHPANGQAAWTVLPFTAYKSPWKGRGRLRRGNWRKGGLRWKENKFHDSALTTTALPSSWTLFDPSSDVPLNGIATGDGASNRDGRTYFVTSIHLQIKISGDAVESQVTPVPATGYKICLIQDRHTNAVSMTAGDVFEASGTVPDIMDFRNLDQLPRFKVLKTLKGIFTRENTNEGAINLFSSPFKSRYVHINYKFRKPLQVHTNATTNGIGAINDDSLHLIACSDQNNALDISYNCRIRFQG